MGRKYCAALAIVLAVTSVPRLVAGRGQADEAAPAVHAASLLDASQRSGAHYTVDDRVSVAGYFYEFHLTSDFGPFTAVGRLELASRIDEIRAIAALQDVSKSQVFLASAGGAVVDIGKGAASAVTDPVATAKGIGAGIKRFGVNLGRTSKRAVERRAAPTPASRARPRPPTPCWCLERHAPVGAESQGGSLHHEPRAAERAEEHRKCGCGWLDRHQDRRPHPDGGRHDRDRRRSRVVEGSGGAPQAERGARAGARWTQKKTASAFFRNGWYTLTLQTRIVAALDAVKKPGCADYLESAAAADTEREALFFVESAEMLQRYHARTPVDRLLADSRAIVAASKGGAVLMAPLDLVRSTSAGRTVLAEIATRARRELGASSLALQITGTISDRAGQDARAAGWTIREPGA